MFLRGRFFFFFLLVHRLLKDRGHFDFLGIAAGQLLSTTSLHQVFHHVADLFHKEGNRPLEEVHSLWQMEGVLHVLVLFDIHLVVFNQDHGAFVVVFTAVVWRAKDCNNRGEGLMATPSMHLVSIDLDLMGSDDRDKVVRAQNLLDGVQAELDGALTLGVRAESHLARVTIIHGVRPQQIAQESLKGRLDESIDAFNVALVAKLG